MVTNMAGQFESIEEFKEHKRQKHNEMLQKQSLPYNIKVRMAENRIRAWLEIAGSHGYGTHISVGGLDSITLCAFIRSLGHSHEEVPAISASLLEDKSIQEVHKEMGVEIVKPLKSKVRVLQEEGFPILSKKIANRIDTIAHPTEKNKTVRHAIITGECGELGHHAVNSKMRLPKKYLEIFGGLDEEGRALGYKAPTNFKVSNKCCYYLKEAPCDLWAREHHSVPFLGLMASEGGQRQEALEENGCNYWGKTTARSAPFSFFYHSDVVRLAVDLGVHIPEIYGEVKTRENKDLPDGIEYYTTGEQRTGCSMCGFGIQLETRPHRFDRLYARNPKEWDFWMNSCCQDEDGTRYGWGRVLDYIGIQWRNPDIIVQNANMQQISLFEYLEGGKT